MGVPVKPDVSIRPANFPPATQAQTPSLHDMRSNHKVDGYVLPKLRQKVPIDKKLVFQALKNALSNGLGFSKAMAEAFLESYSNSPDAIDYITACYAAINTVYWDSDPESAKQKGTSEYADLLTQVYKQYEKETNRVIVG